MFNIVKRHIRLLERVVKQNGTDGETFYRHKRLISFSSPTPFLREAEFPVVKVNSNSNKDIRVLSLQSPSTTVQHQKCSRVWVLPARTA